MKRSIIFAFAALVLAAGVFGQSAVAAGVKQASTHQATLVAKMSGTIGSTPPSANARALVRAAGLDDGSGAGAENGGGSDDGGVGALAGGKIAHGSIGSALPSAGAAGRIRALGLDN